MSGFVSHMHLALDEARKAGGRGEIPVGAVIIDPATGAAIARAGNETRAAHDPTAHAEILAIRRACAHLGAERLAGLDIWVTLEPCPMCAAAIGFARLRRLYYGAEDPKSGGVAHGPRLYQSAALHHAPEVYGGVSETQSAQLLRAFFRGLRDDG